MEEVDYDEPHSGAPTRVPSAGVAQIPKVAGIVEIFCVDVSRSMWLSQSFPYVVGKSKLAVVRDIIDKPLQWTMGEEHWSSLVIFASIPVQVVAFDRHNDLQRQRISSALNSIEHSTGTAIYSAIKMCEAMILQWKSQQPGGEEYKVILHIFTDGIDNSSDTDSKTEFEAEHDLMTPDNDILKHTFLYSFAPDFHEVKDVGAKIGATVIMVDTDDTNLVMELRNKCVFKAISERYSSPEKEISFNLLDGDAPDLVFLHRQLQKSLLVFFGDFLKEEGIFRQSGNLRDVKLAVEKFSVGEDTLEDYESPIQVAHTFKNVVARYTIIPKPLQVQLYKNYQTAEEADKIYAISLVLTQVKEINKKCLSILLEIIWRTAEAQKSLPASKRLSLNSLSTVFAGILLKEVVEPTTGDTAQSVAQRITVCAACLQFLVEQRGIILPPPGK